MKVINGGLTTFAVAAAVVSLAMFASLQSEAQTAVPNAENNRFIPARLQVEPETATPTAGRAAVDTQASSRPEATTSTTFYREAPAAFDNLTNGFDPQGPDFATLEEDDVVPLRSFNDNRFIFEE